VKRAGARSPRVRGLPAAVRRRHGDLAERSQFRLEVIDSPDGVLGSSNGFDRLRRGTRAAYAGCERVGAMIAMSSQRIPPCQREYDSRNLQVLDSKWFIN
jgi:hypothetical protein